MLTDLRPERCYSAPLNTFTFELSVRCEANFESAMQRKEGKYLHLPEDACTNEAATSTVNWMVGEMKEMVLSHFWIIHSRGRKIAA